MDIRFTGKHLSVTKGMKEHMDDKLQKLEKYSPKIIEVHVILEKQKYFFKAELTLLAKNLKVYGDAEAKENIYAAMDAAYLRVEKQLKKSREKSKAHHKNIDTDLGLTNWEAFEELNATIRERKGKKPAIVRSGEFAAKPMSMEEASLQLIASEQQFLVFSNADTNQVNVIYRMDNGNHGLIEPKFQ